MQSILNSAHTWFFDSSSHELDGALTVCLVEGIKGSERQYVDPGPTQLGPYFPVTVSTASRCVEVTFQNAAAFFVYNESYATGDPELKADEGRFLYRVELSSFRKFAEASTGIAGIHQGPLLEYMLWCEDRIFHVLSPNEPVVTLLAKEPDLITSRTVTWSSN